MLASPPSTEVQESSVTGERLHYLDHLRALAMLAGVGFHAALAYSPIMSGFFPTADRQNSQWVDGVVWGMHLVRMPLFFWISGFLAASVVARRGMAGLVRQRLRRILLPFLVAWPLVWLSLGQGLEWAAINVQHPSALLRLVRDYLQQVDPPSVPPGTAHLWFLYYLLLFSVLHWAMRTLDLGRHGVGLLKSKPIRLLLLLPLMLVPALASVSAPHPAPEGFLPQFWAIGFYGAFFAFGVGVQTQPDWLARTRDLTVPLFLGSAGLYGIFLWRLHREPPGLEHPTASWLLATVQSYLSVWLTVLTLLVGRQLLSAPRPILQYLSKSAYWIYLVHLPLLFALQCLLMDLELVWYLKWTLASTLTLALCLLSFECLAKRPPLRKFLA